jgi:hypothetical protein
MSMAISDVVERARRQAEEHERRMATDPAYRAKQESLQVEGAAADRQTEDRRRAAGVEKARRTKKVPEKFWPFLDAYRAGAGTESSAGSVVTAHYWVSRFLRGGKAGWTFLFLAGPPGVGKTAEACWFLDAPIVRTEPVAWGEDAREVTRESAGQFVTAAELSKASSFASDYWEAISDTPRLVVDDLGVEQLDGKGYALSNLAHVLYHRHARALRTVVTLNIARGAFLERYATHDGGRLRDRLTESAWFVDLAGSSLRKRLQLEEEAP